MLGLMLLAPDVLLEFGFTHEPGGLFARAAQDEATAGFSPRRPGASRGLQAGGVDGCHVAKTKYAWRAVAESV